MLDAKIGTVQTQDVNDKFYELLEKSKEEFETRLIKLGNGFRFEASKDNIVKYTGTLISDRYTRSFYIGV
jgi:hypothetical protein